MAGRSIGRVLILTLLALAMGGAGLFSLCGGAMGILFLSEGGGSRDFAWLAFGMAIGGSLLTWGLWWLFSRLRGPRDA